MIFDIELVQASFGYPVHGFEGCVEGLSIVVVLTKSNINGHAKSGNRNHYDDDKFAYLLEDLHYHSDQRAPGIKPAGKSQDFEKKEQDVKGTGGSHEVGSCDLRRVTCDASNKMRIKQDIGTMQRERRQ